MKNLEHVEPDNADRVLGISWSKMLQLSEINLEFLTYWTVFTLFRLPGVKQ